MERDREQHDPGSLPARARTAGMPGGDRTRALRRRESALPRPDSPARWLLVALIAVAAVAGACTGASGPSSTVDVSGVPQGILDAVLEDAAARTGVAAEDITVVEAKAVTWPNGALGCPQPGFMYTEMIVPGYQVVVEVGGELLDYRVGSGGAPTLCENPAASG